jgi:hypothetical protein
MARTADDVITCGGLDARVGDVDGEVPGGDLAFDLAQSTLHAGIDLGLAHAAEEIPFITLRAARWLDEGRMIHVRTEHPSGLALRFAVLVGGQQVAELVTPQLHMRTAFEQRLDLRTYMIFVEGRGRLLEESFENVVEVGRWHAPS